MNTKRSITVDCDCRHECIKFDHEDYGDGQDWLEISLWRLGHYGYKLSVWDRIRWSLNILWTGQPWGDMIIFSFKNKVVELRDYLNNVIDDWAGE